MNRNVTAEQIDSVLPQTQCGLCGYAGCFPYAEAIASNQAAINLCPPGGVQGLKMLAELVDQDPTPYLAEMEKQTKPTLRAVIREDECIGCTKCIQACPVDAILGAAKQMHTVIAIECTGCELCVAPCPVDCIDMITLSEISDTPLPYDPHLARERYRARQARLSREKKSCSSSSEGNRSITSLDDKKKFIQEAVLRAQRKKGLLPETVANPCSKR